jgi:hypothetical protein
MSGYRTNPGDVIQQVGYPDRVVVQVWRGEDIGRFTDGLWRRGSSAERCALHGGQTRTQVFQVRD